jgi:hypothetical protein
MGGQWNGMVVGTEREITEVHAPESCSPVPGKISIDLSLCADCYLRFARGCSSFYSLFLTACYLLPSSFYSSFLAACHLPS